MNEIIMNIYAVPMLLSGVLFTLLAIITWMFRRREKINRIFSLFNLALAIDAFTFFSWFQFGKIEDIHTWMRLSFTAGFFVPVGLIIFFFAFTGYDRRLNDKVLGVKVKHFRTITLLFILLSMIFSQFTELIISIPENPKDIWDIQFGTVGVSLFPLYLVIFTYLFSMAFKSYRYSNNKPEKRFILLVSLGTFVWLVFGYLGALILPIISATWQAISYLGTAGMAMFYFVAIINYQSDKVHELNESLEQKVQDRTRHLRETQAQLVQSEKMAALGHLVAGVAHEMNTPVGVIYSTHDTLAKALEKLKITLENDFNIRIEETLKIAQVIKAIYGVSDVLGQSGERITEIVQKLKLFAQLDEADLQNVDFNETINDTIKIFGYHLKPGVEIVKDFADLPPVTCYPAKINQLCFQLLRNANTAIVEEGEIRLKTEVKDDKLVFRVSDNGRGIAEKDLERIFDPGFTAWDLKVGTGLGLAICYQIAKEHKGKITVHSKQGEGTTFKLSFPVIKVLANV